VAEELRRKHLDIVRRLVPTQAGDHRDWVAIAENAKWGKRRKQQFRWTRASEARSCLLDLASGKVTNVTAVERVSHLQRRVYSPPEGRV